MVPIILSRHTLLFIPALSLCLSVSLSRLHSGDIPPGADLVCTSLQGALDRLQTPPLSHHIQQVFILGGRRLYEV